MNLLVEHTEDITDLMCRLSVAKSEFERLIRDQDGKIRGRDYKYVNLTQLIEKTDPILARHELLVWEGLEVIDGRTGVCVKLVNLNPPKVKDAVSSDGNFMTPPQWIKTHCYAIPEDPGPRGAGTAISYMRRYARLSILGLTQEDDDAQRPQDKGEKPSGADEWGPAKINEVIADIDGLGTRDQFVARWKELPNAFKEAPEVIKKVNGEWKEKFQEK